jgi:hypothetical protein
MRTTWKTIGAGALALALAACGKQSDDFTAATPDAAGLALELAGGTSEGLAATPGAPLARLEAVAPAADAVDELGSARASIKALNAEVRRVLEQVAAVAQQPPTSELGDVKVYGPVVRCVQQAAAGGCQAEASLRLAIRHHYLRTFSWVLEARPAASQDPAAFAPVLAGWMARSAEAHRGRGRAAFNLENLRAAAPGYTGQGYLLAGFGHAGEAKALRYRLLGFTPDAAAREPVTAGFVGFRSATGATRVRVASFDDVVAGSSALPKEVVLAHAGWRPGLGGRGWLVVSNWTDGQGNVHGDVPTAGTTDHYFLGRACWGPGGAPKVKEWRYCARGAGPVACMLTTPVEVQPAGATWATSCTGFTDDEPLPGDVSPGAEQGTEPEPTLDPPPASEPPPATAEPVDTAPPAGP